MNKEPSILNLPGKELVYTHYIDIVIQSSLFILENGFVYKANYIVTLKDATV